MVDFVIFVSFVSIVVTGMVCFTVGYTLGVRDKKRYF